MRLTYPSADRQELARRGKHWEDFSEEKTSEEIGGMMFWTQEAGFSGQVDFRIQELCRWMCPAEIGEWA